MNKEIIKGMEARGCYYDKEKGEFFTKEKKGFRFFPTWKELFAPEVSPHIDITKEEAEAWEIDIKKNPKGFYIIINGIRVPINIK